MDAFYPFKRRCFEPSPMLPQVSRKRERPETVEVICLSSDDEEAVAEQASAGSSQAHAIVL